MGARRARTAARLTLAIACALTAGLASCSLLTDLSGLAGGASEAATTDGSASDVLPTEDAAAAADSAPDAAAPCNKVRVRVVGCEQGAPAFMPGAAGTSAGATLTDDANIIVLGQYRARSSATTTVSDRRSRPHVLVLASYNATSWVVDAVTPSALTKVVLSGYEVSTAAIPSKTLIQDTTPNSPHAHEYPSPAATELLQHVRTVLGTDASVFAGCYGPTSFEVLDACD